MENVSNETITVQPLPIQSNFVECDIKNEASGKYNSNFVGLKNIDELTVKHLTEYLPNLKKFGHNKKFIIFNQNATFKYYALEESMKRSSFVDDETTYFKIHITNELEEEILTLNYFIDKSCNYFFCRHNKQINILSASGDKISTIKVSRRPFHPSFVISDPEGKTIFKITKSKNCCKMMICRGSTKPTYEIMTNDPKKDLVIGYIVGESNIEEKQSHTQFKVTFLMDLDVNDKASLMALTCVINQTYLESNCKRISCNYCSRVCNCFLSSCTICKYLSCILIPCFSI